MPYKREAGRDRLAVNPKNISTEIHSHQFLPIFDRFVELIGADSWTRHVRLVAQEAKGKPFLRSYLQEENRIALALADLNDYRERHGRFPDRLIRDLGHYEACTYVVAFVDMYGYANVAAKRGLVKRTRAALRNTDDLRALKFESLVAVELAKRGFAVDFPEVAGIGTFDLLATKDGISTEIECKSMSFNKGRQVHRRDALEMHQLLHRDLGPIARRMTAGLMIRVVVPDRLPKAHAGRVDLSRRIRRALLSGQSTQDDGIEIRLSPFDVSRSPLAKNEVSAAHMREFLRHQFGIDNREAFAAYTPGKWALVVSLESRRPDRVLDAIFDTIKDACDRQLTGQRPGIVCAKLEDVTADELAEIGAESGNPTALRRRSSTFIDSRRTSPLVGLSFVCNGSLEIASELVRRPGRTYFFENPDSPLYNKSSVAVFRDLGKL